jgi:hypothetical protein
LTTDETRRRHPRTLEPYLFGPRQPNEVDAPVVTLSVPLALPAPGGDERFSDDDDEETVHERHALYIDVWDDDAGVQAMRSNNDLIRDRREIAGGYDSKPSEGVRSQCVETYARIQQHDIAVD